MMLYKVRTRRFLAAKCEETEAAVDVMQDLGIRYKRKMSKCGKFYLFTVNCDYPTWVMAEKVFKKNEHELVMF